MSSDTAGVLYLALWVAGLVVALGGLAALILGHGRIPGRRALLAATVSGWLVLAVLLAGLMLSE